MRHGRDQRYRAPARREGSSPSAAATASLPTAGLEPLPGVTPPRCPADRTHVYHKYRVRLDARALGLRIDPSVLRDRVMAALRAEGVEVMLWLDRPVPEMPVFQGRTSHRTGEHPATTALLADSFVVGSQSYPLFPQPRVLMEQYADAFEKVLGQLMEIFGPGTT